MALKAKTNYECQECGSRSLKWVGRCPGCGAWSSLIEVREEKPAAAKRGLGKSSANPVTLDQVDVSPEPRLSTGIGEFDRVLGGGIVPGSLILIGGDPGIGKSTLLLQVMAVLATAEVSTLYVSGEESLSQIKLRARRLSTPSPKLLVLAETDLARVLELVAQIQPKVLVIDSIQTMFKEELSGSPGSVGQLRECTLALMIQAKSSGTATFLVGHVTKEGQLAGPRIIEHMVDTVVYFEGDRHHSYRLLRSVKNRFGATNEIGVFEMGSAGLSEVKNPSQVFLQEGRQSNPGSVVTCSMEGSRPLLLEVQALVSRASYSVPQRVSQGFDSKRLTILLALLEKFGGVDIGMQDVFLSIAGGFRVEEPAVDLAVAAAIASNHLGKPSPPDIIALGELGLNGELRGVPFLDSRLKEAQRLGFRRALLPEASRGKVKVAGLEPVFARRLDQALENLY